MLKRIVIISGLIMIFIMVLNIKSVIGLLYPTYYTDAVSTYSEIFEVDSCLIYSIIKTESDFRREAKSNKGAIGLMQIMPETGKYISELLGDQEYSESKLLKPEVNIRYGTYYFSKLYNDFDKNSEMAIAAYNAGEGNVRKWIINNDGYVYIDIKSIPFKETKEYIMKVKINQLFYKYLYEDGETIYNLVYKLSKTMLYK